MKICFVVDSYPGLFKFGGIAAYTRTAAHALAARGHEVHVLVARRAAPMDTEDGEVRLHVRRTRWLPLVAKWFPGLGESFSAAWAIFRLHREFGFDVVEFPNWEGLGLIATILPVTRTVVRLHTSMAESIEAAGHSPGIGDQFMMWAEKVSARRACSVITHSKAHRDRLQATYGLGEVAVVPHGVPFPVKTAQEDGGFAGATASCCPLAVLTVGPLNARKGASTLFEAIPLILEKVPGAEFWIVGGTEDHPLAQQFRTAHPRATSRVRFLGFVEGEQLAGLYEKCAIYVSASVYESFGLTFVEAMAHGKPVVGCAVGAIPEIVEPAVNGLLVPPNDSPAFAQAITQLLLDATERKRLGDAGASQALQKYSIERMGEELESFFAKVSSSRS